MEPPRAAPAAVPAGRSSGRRSRPAGRTKLASHPEANLAVPGFRAMLDHAPAPRERPAPAGTAAQVVSMGSSSDGAHLARIKTGQCTDRELLVSILVDRGRVDVRVEASGPEAAAWVQQRTERIREALEDAGLDLASLDLRQRHERGQQQDRGGRHRQR